MDRWQSLVSYFPRREVEPLRVAVAERRAQQLDRLRSAKLAVANEARRVISSQLKHRTAPYLASQFKLIADAVRGVPIVDTQMIQDINRRFETFLGKKGLTAENIHAAQSVVQPAI